MRTLFVGLWLALAAACLAQSPWAHYHNSRYGFELDVPGNLQAREAPANEDGRTFTDERSELLAWGSNNVTSQSLDQAYREALDAARQDGPIGYQASGKNWFVVSWVNGESIVYQKTFHGPGCSQSFRLTYPLGQKSKFDPIVKRVESSFKPGDLSRAH